MSGILQCGINSFLVRYFFYKRAYGNAIATGTGNSDKKVQLQRVKWDKVYEKASVIGSFLTKFYFLFQEEKKKIMTLFYGI